MFPLFLATLTFASLCGFGVYALKFRRDFIGTAKGHHLHLIYKILSYDFIIDGQTVQKDATHSQVQFKHSFGDTSPSAVSIQFDKNSNNHLHQVTLSIDNDTFVLEPVPQNVWGNTNQSQLQKLLPQKNTNLSDSSRLQAANRLYEKITLEIGNDAETQHLLDNIMITLTKHLEIAHRLTEAQPDYQALGGDQSDITETIAKNEHRIQLLLHGLQNIHLTLMQRTLFSREDLQADIQNLLAKLEAQIEVDRKSQ